MLYHYLVNKYIDMPKNGQNVKFVAIRCVLSSSKCTKTRFWRGSVRWGCLRRSLRPRSRLWRGTPALPYPSRLLRLDLGVYHDN